MTLTPSPRQDPLGVASGQGCYRYPISAFNQPGFLSFSMRDEGSVPGICSDLEEEDSKSHRARPLALFPDPSNPRPTHLSAMSDRELDNHR